jgi:hypothetical protein
VSPENPTNVNHECWWCGADVPRLEAFIDRATGFVKCGECVRHDRMARIIATGRLPRDGECGCASCVSEGMEPQRPDCLYWRRPV